MVIKVATNGDIYMDGSQVSTAEMSAALARAQESGEAVTYYRESPRTEPSAAANHVFQKVIEARVAVRLGHQAPSEWGALDWVEVEESPHRSRFFMARGQQFLVAYPPEVGAEPDTYVAGPLEGDGETRWIDQVDLLVRSDRVMETEASEPHLTFDAEALKRPGLHLRVGYGEDPRWASHYERDMAPAHIRAFHRDLMQTARLLVASTDKSSWKRLGSDPEEAL
jgi:hypothetical protein